MSSKIELFIREGKRSARKRGRPKSEAPPKNWKDYTKTCGVCGEEKKISDFPYSSGGKYRKGETCLACRPPKGATGEIIGRAVIGRGKKKKRVAPKSPLFMPTRMREQDLDPVARYALNNEGQIIDFEE